MPRLKPAKERMALARRLIEQARSLSAPEQGALPDLSYVAEVKDLLRQARDQVKFIGYTAGASAETKQQAAEILAAADRAEKELLHRKSYQE